MRYIKWQEGKLLPLEDGDLNDLINSDRWFARKFSDAEAELINRIAEISR